ncbi:Subtilisin-like protease SBT1-7 [Nymphaea thermarum]|nr:Subtilisin-like protease SBT1-7 [Nymphaea thermarum]
MKMSYSVTFTSTTSLPSGTFKFGYLEWSDGKHRVRSPIVFTWGNKNLASIPDNLYGCFCQC